MATRKIECDYYISNKRRCNKRGKYQIITASLLILKACGKHYTKLDQFGKSGDANAEAIGSELKYTLEQAAAKKGIDIHKFDPSFKSVDTTRLKNYVTRTVNKLK